MLSGSGVKHRIPLRNGKTLSADVILVIPGVKGILIFLPAAAAEVTPCTRNRLAVYSAARNSTT